eukprot:CAMPEP_0171713568 /NCGR_PEP_ID=MMETSP0991-20121206/17809_1 /TAXON_ID=483369 /ORGANISM="non described non described, Strain CCMP2098" /LENGTH=244 /DNA_ID=CAMNT_0012304207 /DNA_START=26 /DNA_END=760 /DNA_ORIENTATION=-
MFRASVISLALFGSASAFTPIARFATTTSLASNVDSDGLTTAFDVPEGWTPVINGWAPDEAAFAYGLPGALAPMGNFDPLGLSKGKSLDEMKYFREAEVTHGRVAMLGTLGFLVGENFHPLFGLDGKEILSIDSLTEVRVAFPLFFELLAVLIAGAELNRAIYGWISPTDRGTTGVEGNTLRDDYYPGDIGFDPMGLKPKDAVEFAEIQTKELQNGRLAMLAMAGMVAQELVDGMPILLNDFGI